MKKLTYEEVSKCYTDHNYTLLDIEYTNNRTLMKCQCNICGHINMVKYNTVQQGCECPKCAIVSNTNNKRHSIDFIRGEFANKGYDLISEIYTNANTKLDYLCTHCNTEQSIRYNDLQRGHGCMKCGSLNAGEKMAFSIEDVTRSFADKGYTLLETIYKSATTPMRYVCNTHGEQTITYRSILDGHGCSACFYESNRGEGNPRWLGGLKELRDYLRSNTTEWKKKSMEYARYQCELTGINSRDMQVHHRYPFSNIVYNTMKQLNLPTYQTIGEYTDDELSILTKTFIANHDSYGYGSVLSRSIHMLFHQLYGNINNTPEQFQEFTHRYNQGEFQALLTA